MATSTNSVENVLPGAQVSVPFGQAMDAATINSSQAGAQRTLTLADASGNDVPGTVAMNADNTVATFSPSASALTPDTTYIATVTTAHFEGTMLARTVIAVNTGASANGRLLAQTSVTLQQNAITQPAPQGLHRALRAEIQWRLRTSAAKSRRHPPRMPGCIRPPNLDGLVSANARHLADAFVEGRESHSATNELSRETCRRRNLQPAHRRPNPSWIDSTTIRCATKTQKEMK